MQRKRVIGMLCTYWKNRRRRDRKRTEEKRGERERQGREIRNQHVETQQRSSLLPFVEPRLLKGQNKMQLRKKE